MRHKTSLVFRVLLLAGTGVIGACSGGGGDEQPFTALGIDNGSISSSYTKTDHESGIPDIGAALAAPIDDDYEAARFLHRATFGPTLTSIDILRNQGVSAWIGNQLELPATFMLPITRQHSEPRWREQVNSWFNLAVTADDQLRQRVAYALSQFFVVSGEGELSQRQAALANYYDILLAHSFGNFRELLQQVTLSPVMGNYLSMKGNQKPDLENNIRPDENYARELLQLFSIGLVQLNIDGTVQKDSDGIPLPTYDQEVVEAFAHVFTGWHFKNVDNWNYPKNEDWFSPMQAYPERHDQGEKRLLNEVVLPANQTAEQDLEDALDNVFNHPNVGPFFSQHLIKQLVTSNPSTDYVKRVAEVFNADSNNQRGNIAAVVSAVLTDPEAITGLHSQTGTFGKLREPIVRLVSLWRAFGANPQHREFNFGWVDSKLGQAPLQSPTVFNFFSPDFTQNGDIRDQGLLSPEFQIHNESTIISITSTLLARTLWINSESGSEASDAPIDITRLMTLDGDTNAQFAYLGKLTLSQPPSNGLKNNALRLLEERKNASSQIRAEELLFLFVSSPEAAIQK